EADSGRGNEGVGCQSLRPGDFHNIARIANGASARGDNAPEAVRNRSSKSTGRRRCIVDAIRRGYVGKSPVVNTPLPHIGIGPAAARGGTACNGAGTHVSAITRLGRGGDGVVAQRALDGEGDGRALM